MVHFQLWRNSTLKRILERYPQPQISKILQVADFRVYIPTIAQLVEQRTDSAYNWPCLQSDFWWHNFCTKNYSLEWLFFVDANLFFWGDFFVDVMFRWQPKTMHKYTIFDGIGSVFWTPSNYSLKAWFSDYEIKGFRAWFGPNHGLNPMLSQIEGINFEKCK